MMDRCSPCWPAPATSRTADRSWAYEVKWDGMRLLGDATSRVGSAPDQATNRNDAPGPSRRASPVAGRPLLRDASEGSVLDGEVVRSIPWGRPSFATPRTADPARATRARSRTTRARRFLVFDLLPAGRRRRTPDARTTSGALLAGGRRAHGRGDPRVPDSFDDGEALLASTESAEVPDRGVVAGKRRASTRYHRQGVRSPDWIKVPHPALAVARDRRLEVARTDSRSGWPRSLARRTPPTTGCCGTKGAVGSRPVGRGSVSRTLVEVLGEIVSDDSPFQLHPPRRRAGRRRAPTSRRCSSSTWSTSTAAANGLLRQPSVVRVLRPRPLLRRRRGRA